MQTHLESLQSFLTATTRHPQRIPEVIENLAPLYARVLKGPQDSLDRRPGEKERVLAELRLTLPLIGADDRLEMVRSERDDGRSLRGRALLPFAEQIDQRYSVRLVRELGRSGEDVFRDTFWRDVGNPLMHPLTERLNNAGWHQVDDAAGRRVSCHVTMSLGTILFYYLGFTIAEDRENALIFTRLTRLLAEAIPFAFTADEPRSWLVLISPQPS